MAAEIKRKDVIIIGDIEMGGGTFTDDFISDKALSELILSLLKRSHPVDLVLNGDTFDFLKCPSRIHPETFFPRHITKEVSLAKLKLIYTAHLPVFKAFTTFLSKRKNHIYFILGNHDHDLLQEEVQEEIKRLLGNHTQVHFPGLFYEESGVYVEHGHQYDFLFQINFEKLFLKHKGESILNFPFVSFGLISAFMRMKEQYPFLERISPRPSLLTHHRVVARKVNFKTIGYFLKSMVFYPFRFYSDPTYSFPTNLLRELYHRIRTIHFDVDNITTIFMKQNRIHNEIVILGHLHEKRIAKSRKRIIIHPGSWRDEYDFQPKTRELIPRSKRYVDISIINDKSEYKIVDYPVRRSIFHFDEVIKDEKKHILLAAKEEGYKRLVVG
ncbi:TPA: hypothetical protein HA242_04705 [Candidatus Woesearchaeota archaeon]|nr:hypothetical protein [Candidatus Woesearchaeota archaeon]HIH12999.1 hypothetical protein [Candidatus Woesearchaeota archaeon]